MLIANSSTTNGHREHAAARSSLRALPGAAVIVVAAGLLSACASSTGSTRPTMPEPSVDVRAAIEADDEAFIVPPETDYPLVVDPSRSAEVAKAFRRLAGDGDTGETVTSALNGAATVASDLLSEDSGFHPAIVLAATVDYLEGDFRSAADRLVPVVGELPGYTAAELVLGRAGQRLDDIPLAFEAFSYASERSDAAAAEAERMRPRALEIFARRIDDAIVRNRFDDARASYARLSYWAPGQIGTLRAGLDLASAEGDRVAELAAASALLPRVEDETERLALRHRRAELELEVGNPSVALREFTELLDREPNDPILAEQLERAKFIWRTQQLPEHVRQIVALPELTRADFAALAYWLLPGVRYARTTEVRIAGDILDHPYQREIGRVINLGLLDVDRRLHRFSPDRSIRRYEAMRSLLRALEEFGDGAACLHESSLGSRPTAEAICAASSRCRMIDDDAGCLPSSPLSGREALELVRRTLRLFSKA